MTEIKKCFVLLLLCRFSAGFDDYFSIVGPRSIQFGEDYVAFLSTTNVSVPEDLDVSIYTQKPKVLVTKQTFKLPTNQEIRFNLKSQTKLQDYVMIAEIRRRNIMHHANIFTIEKKTSVLILTEKSVYKAGDNVKFRVLVIDRDTKPYQYKKMSVFVTDGNKNKVSSFKALQSPIGVYQASVLLSDEPAVGKWGIHVKVDDDKQITTKNFEVREYVLPRFEAVIDTKPAIVLSDGSLQATIFGRYSFGKLVTGKAKVNVKVFKRSIDETPTHEFDREVDLKSNETLSFDFASDLKIVDKKKPHLVKLSLTVEEILTKKEMSTESIVKVNVKQIDDTEQLEIVSDEKFKPGLPYEVKVLVKEKNGRLIKNLTRNLFATVHFYNKSVKNCTENIKKDVHVRGEMRRYNSSVVDGVANFSIDTESKNNLMHIAFLYDNLGKHINVFRVPSRSREYLEAKTSSNDEIQIGENVTVTVKGSQDFKTLYAVLLGRTGVIFSKVFDSTTRVNQTFNFEATPEMIPEATLFVYYHQISGEIIHDRLILAFQKRFPNTLAIDIPEQAEPSKNVTINLKTSPNSHIFMSAIDVSVNYLKSGHSFPRRDVYTEFLNNAKPHQQEFPTNARYPDFFEANSIIITNADKGFNDCSSLRLTSDSVGEEQEVNMHEESEEIETSEARKDFPETWLFEDFEVKNDGNLEIIRKVPDSITTWVVSGFSINPEVGLGVSAVRKLRVTKEFFVQIEMPHSLVLGEVAKVDVFVFNYEKNSKAIDASVELRNDENAIEFVEVGKDCSVKVITDKRFNTKRLKVEFDSFASTSFFIRATSTGDIKLNFKASPQSVIDSVEKTLKVNHEGASHYFSKSLLVDVRTQKFYSYYFSLDINQEEILSESTKVGASAIGNIMGAEIHETSKKTGLVKFVWNMFNLEYLKAVKNLPAEKKAKIVADLSTGYQDLIKHRVSDKSFGTVWFTAFAVKCLGHVKNWIELEVSYLNDASTFLDKTQANDGGFKEILDGNQSISLTAYTAIAFLETENQFKRFESAIKHAITFIHSNYNAIENNYELAMCAYALTLRKDSNAESFLNQLERNAIIEDEEMHWNLETKKKRSESLTVFTTKVEIASYALLANLKAERLEPAKLILKWLIKNKGGFLFSIDTIVLQALAEAAKVFHSDNFQLDVYFNDDDDKSHGININEKNSFNQQKILLPAKTTGVSVMANGTGTAVLDVWWKFNLKVAKISKKFDVSVTVNPKSTDTLMRLKVCTNFIPDVNQTQAEMAVVEAAMPSGYEFDSESKKLLEAADVKRFETRESKTIVQIYLENLSQTPVCFEVQAIKKNDVQGLKQVPVKVHDFYHPENFGLEFYQLSGEKSCKV